MSGPSPDRRAVGAAGGAAVLWATYYIFILALPASENLAIILVTPILGGAITLGVASVVDRVGLAECRRALVHPRVIASGLLFVAFQFGAVLSTRSVGAVNTSLIVLASDVAGTPLLFALISRGEGPRFRRPRFWAGVGIIAFAGTLTIVAGGSPEPLSLATLALGAPLFLVSSSFVVMTDSATRRLPMLVVLGVGPILVSGLAAVVAAGVVGPGVLVGSVAPSTVAILLGMSALNYAAAPALFFWSARRISLVIPSILQAAIPVFTLVYVASFGLQPVTAIGLIGVPLAFLGALIAVRTPPAGPQPPPTLPLP